MVTRHADDTQASSCVPTYRVLTGKTLVYLGTVDAVRDFALTHKRTQDKTQQQAAAAQCQLLLWWDEEANILEG